MLRGSDSAEANTERDGFETNAYRDSFSFNNAQNEERERIKLDETEENSTDSSRSAFLSWQKEKRATPTLHSLFLFFVVVVVVVAVVVC